MKLTTKQKEAQKELKYYIKPSTTLIIQITHQSRSGMSRKMKVYTADKKAGRLDRLTYHVADLLDYKYNNDDTITVGGCGMDMTFWLADTITHYLYNGKTPKNAKGNGGSCLDWQTIY
jgi:hypothetical protein